MNPIGAFAVQTPQRVRFGRGVAAEAAAAASTFGGSVALIHGRSAARADWLLSDLRAEGLTVRSFSCPVEPTLPMLTEALDTLRGARVIIGLGGGAVIDLAKAVAGLLPAPGDPLDHLEVVGRGLPLVADPLPFIAIPTTSGTGAEVTKNAVIGVPEYQRKVSLRDDRMLADLALVDPSLTDGCTRNVTLASGLDAITQVIEPYLSCKANPVTDALCRDAIPRGLAAIRRLMAEEDPAARDDMALVSLFGGLALANSGLGAVHGFAGVLGSMTGAAHGAICGVLLPHVIVANRDAVAEAGGDTDRFLEIERWMSEAGFDGPGGLSRWAHAAGLPTLPDLGLSQGDIPDVVDASRGASSMKGNPVVLSDKRLGGILSAACQLPA